MITRSSRTSFLFAACALATVIAPLAAALAANGSPNEINNATSDRRGGSTGSYDNFDKYRDTDGFPLSGWQYLLLPPS